MNKQKLLDRLKAALLKSDMDQIKEVRQQLLEFEIDDKDFKDFAKRVRGRVLLDLEDEADEPSQIIEDAVRSMTGFANSWITQQIYYAYNRFYEQAIRDAMRVSTKDLGLYRYMMGLPVDPFGVIHPLGPVVQQALPQGSSEDEIFSQISEMIVVSGAPYFEITHHQFQHVFKLSPKHNDILIMQPDLAVSRGIRDKIGVVNQMFRRDASSLEDHSKAMKFALEKYEMRIFVELRHELLRVKGLAESGVIENLKHIDGYTLRSVFMDETEGSHRKNDGIYYAKGSVGWEGRLKPPYRKNCRCFKVPNFVSSGITAHTNPFMLREDIMIRDFRKFRQWYDGQLPDIQAKVQGEERYALNPHPTKSLASAFDMDGSLVTINRLKNEGGNPKWSVDRHNWHMQRAQQLGNRYDEVKQIVQYEESKAVELDYFHALMRHLSTEI